MSREQTIELFKVLAAGSSGTTSGSSNDNLLYKPTLRRVSPETGKGAAAGMTDPDKRHLESLIESANREATIRIEATNREGQLRLDGAMNEIKGTINLILERTEGIKTDVAAARQSETQHFQWLAGLIIATALGIAACVFAGESLWAGGFSSGQSDRLPQSATPTK